VKYPDLLSAMSPVPHKEEFPVSEPPENPTFSDGNDDSVDNGQQEGDNVDCDPTSEASCFSYKTHLLKKIDIKDLVRDLNLFKKPAEPLGFRLKSGIFSTKVLKYVKVKVKQTRYRPGLTQRVPVS
jgi:hypothetical protein